MTKMKTEERVPVVVMKDQIESLLRDVEYLTSESIDGLSWSVDNIARTLRDWLKMVDSQ